jgi:hypothetical protein
MQNKQSDCVHEQVAKADCECPLYDVRGKAAFDFNIMI